MFGIFKYGQDENEFWSSNRPHHFEYYRARPDQIRERLKLKNYTTEQINYIIATKNYPYNDMISSDVTFMHEGNVGNNGNRMPIDKAMSLYSEYNKTVKNPDYVIEWSKFGKRRR